MASHKNTQLPTTPSEPTKMKGRCPYRAADRLLMTAEIPDTNAMGHVATPAREIVHPHWFTVCCTNAQ